MRIRHLLYYLMWRVDFKLALVAMYSYLILITQRNDELNPSSNIIITFGALWKKLWNLLLVSQPWSDWPLVFSFP